HPEMADRIVITNRDKKCLDAIKSAIRENPRFHDFRNFALDDENLNEISPSEAERSPLTDSGDNRYVSIGLPKAPWHGFGALLEEVRKTRAEIDRPGSPHHGKKLMAWTINDPDQIRQ